MITFTIHEREQNLPAIREACQLWGAKITVKPSQSDGIMEVAIECASTSVAFYIGNSAGFREAMRK